MFDIYSFLHQHNISYQRFDHPAVATCQEAALLCPTMPGKSIKNLFLYDKRSDQHFLVVVEDSKRVDLKKLQQILDVSHLSFASEERLKKYLGLEPGSVSVLGLIRDIDCKVTVIFDECLRGAPLQCHPLVNTATLVIPGSDIERFIMLTQHEIRYLNIPERVV